MVNSPEARCSSISSSNRRSSSRPVREPRSSDSRPDCHSPVQEQPLLRREAERALVPSGIREHAELAEQLAHERGARTGHGHVVRGPRIARDGVLAAARVAARLALQLEQHEVAEPAPVELPRGAQSGDAAADDDDGHAHGAARRGHRRAVAQPMADRGALVHPAAGDARPALAARRSRSTQRRRRGDARGRVRTSPRSTRAGTRRDRTRYAMPTPDTRALPTSWSANSPVQISPGIRSRPRQTRRGVAHRGTLTDSPGPTPARSSARAPACSTGSPRRRRAACRPRTRTCAAPRRR